MNLDTYEKICNVLYGIIGLCVIAMFVFFNYTVVIGILLFVTVACWIIKDRLFKKVCEDHDSQEEES